MERRFLSDIVVKDIYYLITIHVSRGETRRIIDRPRTGLVFMAEGKLIYDCNGKHHEADRNHVLLLPLGGNYTIKCLEKSICPMIDFITDPPILIPDIISFNIGNDTSFLKIFHQLDTHWTFKKGAYRLRCMAGLYDMLVRLGEMETRPYTPNYKYDLIRPSIDYLEASYTQRELTNEILSEKSNISTVYFRKLFTDKYGISPMKYVQSKRIEKAQDMLKHEFATITGIAESIGFNSIYQFSRAFKKATGCTPSEYSKFHAQGDTPDDPDKPDNE